MYLTKIRLEGVTAFRETEIDFSPGLNIIVGPNGVGKTHLLQTCYAAATAAAGPRSARQPGFAKNLMRLLLTYDSSQVNSLKRDGCDEGVVVATLDDGRVLRVRLPRSGAPYDDYDEDSASRGADETAPQAVYIETMEALGHRPGNMIYGEAHGDLMNLVKQEPLPAPVGPAVATPLTLLERQLPGPIVMRDGRFVALSGPRGEPSRLSRYGEGVRRLALVWLLVRNGSIGSGSTLIWDEPATGLGPLALNDVAEALLALARAGTQVILTTHDYVLLEELRLHEIRDDATMHHALYNSGDGTAINSHVAVVEPNPINEAYENLYNRAIRRSLAGFWSETNEKEGENA